SAQSAPAPSAARLVRLGHVEQVLGEDDQRGEAEQDDESDRHADQVLELLASHGRVAYCCHIRIQWTSRLTLSLTGAGSSFLTPQGGMIVPRCSSPVLPRSI